MSRMSLFVHLLVVLLEATDEGVLFFHGLEASVSELGGSIDQLEGNLLQSRALGVDQEGLAEGEDTLLDTDAAALDHQEVFVDDTVMGETTHGGDGLLGDVEVGTGVVLLDDTVDGVDTLADTVDLLVHLSAVMVTGLTSAGHGEADTGRMPSTDTGDLAETLVCLARQLLGSPTL